MTHRVIQEKMLISPLMSLRSIKATIAIERFLSESNDAFSNI
jgi:hypothetical protein